MSTNVPVTVWQPTDGNSEFSTGSAVSIVDTAAVQLVDTAGISIVDTGVTKTLIPATVWAENDSV